MMLLHKKRPNRIDSHILNIPDKANRILNIILIAMVLIIMRLWHLSVIEYDDKVEEASKPKSRIVVEPAKRATIRDRFNIPLAQNKIRYQAAIVYSQLREIPRIAWETDHEGKRVKKFKRKEYIAQLSQILGKELDLDPARIEDLIYAKASYYYQIPFILKEDISETQYYRLKMLEKDWLGIHVQRVPKRFYPKGRVASDIIGYMGAINRSEYDSIIHEMKSLEKFIQDTDNGIETDVAFDPDFITEARKRLKELQEKAYTINDYVGKTGIEGMFEEELRGFHGKKTYYSDARGNFLRELPGSREPLSGDRFLLTISSELQEFAEQLLVQNEEIREGKVSSKEFGKRTLLARQPWIKGGAIVAMDPITGEVLALASHPRFDPNDFIHSGLNESKEKRSKVSRWFESLSYLGEIWDQKHPLSRELYQEGKLGFYDQEKMLTWQAYIDFVLPVDSTAHQAMGRIVRIKDAVSLQNDIQELLDLSGQENIYHLVNKLFNDSEHVQQKAPSSYAEKERLDKHLKEHEADVNLLKGNVSAFLQNVKHNSDKVLVIDLCRLAVCSDNFSQELLSKKGDQSINDYRRAVSAGMILKDIIRKKAVEIFHELDFKKWRTENEKAFLKQKREEEKIAKAYAKPYIDYLDAQENLLFSAFWDQNAWNFLIYLLNGEIVSKASESEFSPYYDFLNEWKTKNQNDGNYLVLKESIKGLNSFETLEYLKTMRSFKELNRPLLGKYPHLRNSQGKQLEKHLAVAFYPVYGFGYGRSQAYRQAATQGSIFKLVTAYEALSQRYQYLTDNGLSLNQLNPFEFVDDVHKRGKNWCVGYQLDGKPIPQLYKGGRLPRSRSMHMGRMDILKAIEISSNSYFSLLASDFLESPTDLTDSAHLFSFGCKTGIDLTAEIPGKIPSDVEENRTGLYSLAIGQHSLVVTPLQTAVMMSAIANGGKVLKPKIVYLTAGREKKNADEKIALKQQFSYQETLGLVGIDFPLFTAVDMKEERGYVNKIPTEVKREIFFPNEIRQVLLEGMRRVVVRNQQEGAAGLRKLYEKAPQAANTFIEMKSGFLGKTSTAEALEHLDLDKEEGRKMCTHVWFGGISFDQNYKKDDNTFIFNDAFGKPELVVVVYLRFGTYGKEGAPLAAQVVKKWRDIKNKYKNLSEMGSQKL